MWRCKAIQILKIGAGNNWAKGHYTEGSEISECALDSVRRETERCDSLQGFQILHSLGGGTGSGLGTLLITKLREEFPAKMMVTYSVLPSPKASDSVVEPYNTVLSMHQLIESADQCITLDNEALYDICNRSLHLGTPTYGDLNRLISMVMSSTTCSLRFPGQLNTSLRKLAVNLVPFPRLHFFIVGFAPLYPVSQKAYRRDSVQELLRLQFSRHNLMCGADITHGRFLSCTCIFRGPAPPSEVDFGIQEMLSHKSAHFVDWIPNNMMTSICDVPPPHLKQSSTILANNTAISQVWRRISDQFGYMFRRKAFLHWYLGEGMEEMEFINANADLNDLIDEYMQYESMSTNENDEDVEEGLVDQADYCESLTEPESFSRSSDMQHRQQYLSPQLSPIAHSKKVDRDRI